MAKLTPMMEQYFEIKNKYKYCLLFFRLGDFYEMFYDDAIIASKELDLTLTGKDCGQKERAPMCGVPFHSADNYISKLVEKGYKVAICEQIENPKKSTGSIVKRDVVRVVTPGTITDNNMLDETKNNYIMCIYYNKNGFGISICDVTTGEFQTTQFTENDSYNKIIDEIARINPAEIICNEHFKNCTDVLDIKIRFNIELNLCENWYFDFNNSLNILCKHFNVLNLECFGMNNNLLSIHSSGALMQYLDETQKNDLKHITTIKNYSFNSFMMIDASSRRNLELTENIREKKKQASLLWVIDKTKTAMGARLLRKWIEQPLIDKNIINKRLNAVEELKNNFFLREEIKEALKSIKDFERIMSKIVYQNANCKDLIALKNSIENFPLLKNLLKKSNDLYLKELYEKFDILENIHILIDKAINDDAPFTVREGGMIKFGYNNELDILLQAKTKGENWLLNLESEEREKTGIKNLKIKYNKVFGYYIEITKSNLSDVPQRYIRKQTLANCERYTIPELSELEEIILNADTKIVDVEYEIFVEIRNAIADEVERVQYCAYIISVIDSIQSFAEIAELNNYQKPIITNNNTINIKEGRHPVVEKLSKSQFIPNDIFLDNNEDILSIITGPNMAGKSTYMRQTALIVLMAQIGCFVPAKFAEISIVDRIFTRVGASDDLASGQSTFMVEMTEVANILNNATDKSLLILDEIGRGTSTFDGLSIAWAVLEFIIANIRAKTLFATHYHELTELEGKINGVKNYCISVKENGEDIIFLRKIKRGGAENSYGVQVAKLAGLPKIVIERSNEILKQLNEANITKETKKLSDNNKQNENNENEYKLLNIEQKKLLDELNNIDVMSISPIEALQVILDLQKKEKKIL